MMIKNIVHLKKLSKGKSKKFHIKLLGWIKSVKQIKYDAPSNRFSVLNEIDDTSQSLTPDELMSKKFSNIGESIKKKAFYLN